MDTIHTSENIKCTHWKSFYSISFQSCPFFSLLILISFEIVKNGITLVKLKREKNAPETDSFSIGSIWNCH